MTSTPTASPPTSSSSAPASPGWSPTAELADAGKRVLLLDQEPRADLGGQAFWSFGGLFLVDSPEQRRMGIRDSLELAWQDWLGTRAFDRATEDHWPRAVGRGLRRLRRRREARLAARPWACGSSRSSAGPSAAAAAADGHGNSVPALPHHLGHRPRGRRAVRAAGARGRGARAWCSFAFRHRVDELVVDRRRRRPACAARCWSRRRRRAARPSSREVEPASSSSRAQAVDRHLRRHRRQPRPGPRELAASGSAPPPRAHDHRRARARRRADARHHRGRRRARSSTATGCGTTPRASSNWDPIWAEPRHPDPARPVVAVARRAPAGGCRRRSSRASTPSARCEHIARAPATTTPGSC